MTTVERRLIYEKLEVSGMSYRSSSVYQGNNAVALSLRAPDLTGSHTRVCTFQKNTLVWDVFEWTTTNCYFYMFVKRYTHLFLAFLPATFLRWYIEVEGSVFPLKIDPLIDNRKMRASRMISLAENMHFSKRL